MCPVIDPDSPWWHVAEAIAACLTALIAAYAAFLWRRQLRGASKHQTATDVLEAARLFRYLFYDARNMLYTPDEFPADYYDKQDRFPSEEAEAWAHIYTNRLKLLEPQVHVLATMRARAGAVLGDDVADAIERLAKKGRQLRNYMQERVTQIRAGDEIVGQWPNKEWNQLVRDSVWVNPDRASRDDAYSLEFEALFTELETIVQPFV